MKRVYGLTLAVHFENNVLQIAGQEVKVIP